ncbi:MAG: SLBB domain-containing protein [Syntrophales bacterium]|nr:SLBB domain-containing protein [Syntrophales bacterium]
MKHFMKFLLILVIMWAGSIFAQQPSITVKSIQDGSSRVTEPVSPPQLPPSTQLKDIYQQLTPEQRQTLGLDEIQKSGELQKKGEKLTPEAIEALKKRPEYKGITPEEVTKGKEMLEYKGAVQEEESLFTRFRKIGKYQNIPLNLKPFGYEFFKTAAVRLVTDRSDIPVPLKYVIGPGDEVRLLLWGRVNAQYNLIVDRDGKITIPQIGPLYVAGMTFEEMSKQIIKQAEQIVGTNVDVTLGALKTIPIFVLGDVRRPGAYTIGSFATITDALLLAGGPTEIGSMRKIQLRRKGETITTLDLYDLFLRGDKSKDVTLMAGDVIFVPVTGPLVGIAGHVKRPAIYELSTQHDLKYLVDIAGGIIPSAYTRQIQVERIVKNEKQIVVDIDDKNLEKAKNFILQDGDLVKVFPIVEMDVNIVTLNGNVKRPGKYEYKKGMKIGDVVKIEELLPETYLDYALIKRLEPPLMNSTLVPVNLKALLFSKDENHNIELMPQDEIYVFSKWFFEEKPYVTVEGEIRGECHAESSDVLENRTPGFLTTLKNAQLYFQSMEKDLSNRGMNDLAAMVGEINSTINAGKVPPAGKLLQLRIALQNAGESSYATKILEFENLMRPSCRLKLEDNMRVRDAILASGGLTNEAYLKKAQIVRKDASGKLHTLFFSVEKALAGDPEHNIPLEKEDKITIHSIYEHEVHKFVTIDGEVTKPGKYQYTENMYVKDLVFKAGNTLESAYLDEAELFSSFIDEQNTMRTERRVINLRKALSGDPEHNVLLKPRDYLLVKRIPNWGPTMYVTLMGEFRFPGKYAIQKGERLSSVIERAGGYLPTAYLRAAYFTRESVRKLQQKSLEDMTKRMERELLAGASTYIASSLTAEEAQAKSQEMQMKQRLIDHMRSLKATGRMTIHLAHPRLLKGSIYDIELEDGDTLYIPQKSSVVNVIGAVMSEGTHVYNSRWSYIDYIKASGGFSTFADEDNVFVLKVDGSARKLKDTIISWDEGKERWEFTAFGRERFPQIEPGDVIVVPEKITTIAWLREIRDITQILMNTAVTAATIIKLF